MYIGFYRKQNILSDLGWNHTLLFWEIVGKSLIKKVLYETFHNPHFKIIQKNHQAFCMFMLIISKQEGF